MTSSDSSVNNLVREALIRTSQQLDTSDPEATAQLLTLLNETTSRALALLGQEREPITLYDVMGGRGSDITDHTFRGDMDATLASRLQRSNVDHYPNRDPESWEIHPDAHSTRYLVRESDQDDETVYHVYDTDYIEAELLDPDTDHEQVPSYDEYDEDDAQQAADEGNRQDAHPTHAHPFAWNVCWEVEHESDVSFLRDAGFVVWIYEGDTIVAGIDGGGYDFASHHFAPLLLALALAHGWTVATEIGPRRVSPEWAQRPEPPAKMAL
jgi:hypothetical protein